VLLKPKPRLKVLVIEKNFGDIAIKGRQSMGNLVTKNDVHKITLKERGASTLGGRKVWFDRDVLRLNYDGRGDYLGEFQGDDQILIVHNNGDFQTTNFDISNHYDDGIIFIEKFNPGKSWTAALYDADQSGYAYLKRFTFEASQRKLNFMGENPDNKLILLTDTAYPRLEVTFGGHDDFREALIIDAEEFIAVKSFKAKGKRLSTYDVASVVELEPIHQPEIEQNEAEVEPDTSYLNEDNEDIEDDNAIQGSLF
jgi:topoisomerase-4 subunit A